MSDGPVGFVSTFLDTLRQSVDETCAQITNVRYAPIDIDDPKDELTFDYNGAHYQLPLGDYVLGVSEDHDRRIAYIALLRATAERLR